MGSNKDKRLYLDMTEGVVPIILLIHLNNRKEFFKTRYFWGKMSVL